MADPSPLIVISGAPELTKVPATFWRRFARFLREGHSGSVTFNVQRGESRTLDVRETMRDDDDEKVIDRS